MDPFSGIGTIGLSILRGPLVIFLGTAAVVIALLGGAFSDREHGGAFLKVLFYVGAALDAYNIVLFMQHSFGG